MEKILVYTNKQCPYCAQIKELLIKENIEFTSRITEDYKDEWNKVVGITNLPTVPTIVIDNSYFVPGRDFTSPQHLVDRIKNHTADDANNELKILERLKTFNFQVSTAFSRVDQLLKQIENKLNIEDEHKITS